MQNTTRIGKVEALTPLVSIIVPVYKVEKYLAQCLDSLLAQTLKEIEIICINDDSPDASPAILDEYAARDGRIKVIHQENRGVSAARNAGLEVASAPYVAFVDSDDWVATNAFTTAVNLMESAPDIDLVGWRVTEISEPKGKIRPNTYRTALEGSPFVFGPEALTKVSDTFMNKLYKTTHIKENKLQFLNVYAEDVTFALSYFPFVRKAVFIKDNLYFYRRHQESITFQMKNKENSINWAGSTVLKGFTELTILDNLFFYYDKMGHLPKYKEALLEMRLATALSNFNPKIHDASFWEQIKAFANKYELSEKHHQLIAQTQKLGYCPVKRYSSLEKIFSIKNSGAKKIIRLFGLTLTIDRK